jgi:DNA invertase Pin-like site-specific DNA recombinase
MKTIAYFRTSLDRQAVREQRQAVVEFAYYSFPVH